MKTQRLIVGNWKMYKTETDAEAYLRALIPLVEKTTSRVYIAVPFTSIEKAASLAEGTNIVIGAQNMHDVSEGAFTGEIAAKMLIEAGAKFVILGHSERRRYFHEDNTFINKKVKRALESHIQPLLCIGETQEERAAGHTEEVLKLQLTECLADLTASQLATLIVAYEPVWAIGTDQTATPETAQIAQAFCRKQLQELFGEEIAKQTPILYGGSVKPENAKELLSQPDIDGLLVGGASLSVDSFSKIVNIEETNL